MKDSEPEVWSPLVCQKETVTFTSTSKAVVVSKRVAEKRTSAKPAAGVHRHGDPMVSFIFKDEGHQHEVFQLLVEYLLAKGGNHLRLKVLTGG